MMKKIGILHGMETSFPEAIVKRINEKNVPGILAEPVQIDKVIQGATSDYAVIIDRISQDVPFYRAYLKNAALNGTAVINNPFWWSADEKFFNNCLAIQVGVPVPRTVLLPSNQMPPDTTSDSFKNLKYPMDWPGISEYVGFPAYMKPHSGGGWKSVYRVESLEDMFEKHKETDTLVMLLQEEIVFEEYYRCYCIGGKYVKIMPYEPRNAPHLRYVTDTEPSARMLRTLTDYVLRLNHALGYDFNTVEFAVRGGVPYAIDFCNPAPDADVNSVGIENFEWVVEHAALYAIERALLQTPGKDNLTWGSFLREAAYQAQVSIPKKRGRKPLSDKTPKVPGKRGRPAKIKDELAEVAMAPKKRGRPAKPKDESAVAAPPKKRGRPAKPKTDEAPRELKKRGRKPKAAITGKVKAEPKKRGRKPKADKPVRQKRVKMEKPFGDLIGLEAVLAAEKMMSKDS